MVLGTPSSYQGDPPGAQAFANCFLAGLLRLFPRCAPSNSLARPQLPRRPLPASRGPEPGARRTAQVRLSVLTRPGREGSGSQKAATEAGRGVANAVGGIKLGGGANAGSAAELSRAPAAKIRSGVRATHWAGVLVGPGLYKAL